MTYVASEAGRPVLRLSAGAVARHPRRLGPWTVELLGELRAEDVRMEVHLEPDARRGPDRPVALLPDGVAGHVARGVGSVPAGPTTRIHFDDVRLDLVRAGRTVGRLRCDRLDLDEGEARFSGGVRLETVAGARLSASSVTWDGERDALVAAGGWRLEGPGGAVRGRGGRFRLGQDWILRHESADTAGMGEGA